jgi:putative endonuclease
LGRTRQQAEKAGRRAETCVAIWLTLRGYRVLARRYKVRAGEIDLIVRRGKVLAFIEVKQRAKAAHAVDPVTARSEERIIRAGEAWLAAHPSFVREGYSLRYDVISVIGSWRIIHQKDVFRGW